jgi:hypothetical protein
MWKDEGMTANQNIEHPGYVRLLDALSLLAPGEGLVTLLAVLALHRPIATLAHAGYVIWSCEGCDPGPYPEGPAEGWCSTLQEAAKCLGVAQ